MKFLIIISCLLAVTQAMSFFELVKDEFEAFKLKFERKYENEAEEKLRLKIFAQNKHLIAKHNQLFEKGLVPYKMKLNRFGDLLHFEFIKAVNGFNLSLAQNDRRSPLTEASSHLRAPPHAAIPPMVDWRKMGAVTEVKNQGRCGSCWSFSATGALEGQMFRKTGKLVSLSEQNLVDCSVKYGNNGCNGGLMDNAFRYIKDAGGIDSEKSYPYVGASHLLCRYNSRESVARDTGYVDIPENNEKALTEAIALVGPISVAIDASQPSFQFYSEGVYYEPECTDRLDHGVLAVGYGTDPKSGDYYIVKNSWGPTWGEGGFIKMARNKNNHCGIAKCASYPLV